MNSVGDEVRGNFEIFKSKWTSELGSVQQSMTQYNALYLISYKRLTSLNSWRELIIKQKVSEGAYSFFCEAQNDAVTSHVFAQLGSWRASHKCLRSCIENILFCEFYKDHQVELKLWETGQHRTGFSELISYFRRHPNLEGLSDRVHGLERLQTEYSVLSRAVHGTGVNFRMTSPGGKTLLWSPDKAKLGVWATREKGVILGINLLLMAIYKEYIQGASLPGLRKAISYSISLQELRNDVKSEISVNLDL